MADEAKIDSEQSLRQAHGELELRVHQRTAELAEANRLLKQEIGQRRRAEEANAKFAAIVESSSDAIIGQKLDGTIATWNAGAERIFGYTAEEARGRPIGILSPPDHSEEAPQIIQAIRRGEPVQNIETERIRKDGERIQVSLTISPIKDAADRIVGASRIARDITQRKQMEQALRDSEAKSHAILETAVDGIITISERGMIESLNRAAERLFGYSAAEITGQNVKMLMPQPYQDEHDQYLRNYLATGRAKIIGIGREVVGCRKDGSIFPLDLAVSEVRLGHRRIFTGVVRDLSERKRLEQEILDVSDREKRRIGQDLHDGLGQLLAGIGFKSKSLENKITSKGLPEAQSARQIAELVTQAIGQARALAHGLQPVEKGADGLMLAIRELCEGLAKLYPINCSFICPQPVMVDDPAQATHFYRIAQEAANNALKHGHATDVVISLMHEIPGVRLSVQDNGSGFDEQGTLTSGMGLHIMRYRAAMVGGILSIQKAPGGGTLVTCATRTV